MNRGEVWWAEAPSGKRRPYLILSRQAAVPVLHSVIAVPATRTIRNIASEVALDAGDGMPTDSVLAFDALEQMPKSLLVERICRLAPARLFDVCRALATATGCLPGPATSP